MTKLIFKTKGIPPKIQFDGYSAAIITGVETTLTRLSPDELAEKWGADLDSAVSVSVEGQYGTMITGEKYILKEFRLRDENGESIIFDDLCVLYVSDGLTTDFVFGTDILCETNYGFSTLEKDQSFFSIEKP